MAQFVISQSKVLYNGYDFSGDINRLSFALTKDDHDDTALGDTAHSHAAGLEDFELGFSGFLNIGATNNDGIFIGDWGTAAEVMTVLPENAVEGKIGYSVKGINLSHSILGEIGGLAPITGAAKASGTKIVRGKVLATGDKSSSGNGSAYQLGAVSSSQYVYGILHCTAVSGTGTPTITVVVSSAAAENMSGSTPRLSFTAKTAIGVQWITPVAGEITDTWWRAAWTVSGTNPSLTVYCVVGIL